MLHKTAAIPPRNSHTTDAVTRMDARGTHPALRFFASVLFLLLFSLFSFME